MRFDEFRDAIVREVLVACPVDAGPSGHADFSLRKVVVVSHDDAVVVVGDAIVDETLYMLDECATVAIVRAAIPTDEHASMFDACAFSLGDQ